MEIKISSIKLIIVVGISLAAVVVTLNLSGILSLPSFQPNNNVKLHTTSETKQVVHLTNKGNAIGGLNRSVNILAYKILLNNSTHIDTPYVKEYSLPNGTWPNSILIARNGMVWTVGTKSHTLISFDPKQSKVVASYPITTNSEKTNQSSHGFQMAWSIVEDNDGSIWVPQGGADPLWIFDPHTGKFQVIHSISAAPVQMKVDQKTGNVWFTTFDRGTFGVIQKSIGKETSINNNVYGSNNTNTNPEYKVTEFNLGNESFPSGIFIQGDSIWITETPPSPTPNKIVEFKPIEDTNGRIDNITKVRNTIDIIDIFYFSF